MIKRPGFQWQLYFNRRDFKDRWFITITPWTLPQMKWEAPLPISPASAPDHHSLKPRCPSGGGSSTASNDSGSKATVIAHSHVPRSSGRRSCPVRRVLASRWREGGILESCFPATLQGNMVVALQGHRLGNSWPRGDPWLGHHCAGNTRASLIFKWLIP